jgi:hypothetical protein
MRIRKLTGQVAISPSSTCSRAPFRIVRSRNAATVVSISSRRFAIKVATSQNETRFACLRR